MKNKHHFIEHPKSVLAFAFLVFFINALTLFLIHFGSKLLMFFDILPDNFTAIIPVSTYLIMCLIIGTLLALILGNIPMRPINQVLDAVDAIADGDYSTRINLKGPKSLQLLSKKFNHMANELDSVEMLRTDFVNNFSHEFKTPISSIQGFAQVLLDRDVPPDKQKEYLEIIAKESARLTDLATDVLNLSKLDQQAILSDKTNSNINEQIRTSVIELYSKWPDKNIDYQFDHEATGDTFTMCNEALLKQVWINLLDNAIKFSPNEGLIKIDIKQNDNIVHVMISNQGEAMSQEDQNHIFDRFYQGDTSHATQGNGLGLTIAKKTIDLHNGKIYVENKEEGWITFHVELPYIQKSLP